MSIHSQVQRRPHATMSLTERFHQAVYVWRGTARPTNASTAAHKPPQAAVAERLGSLPAKINNKTNKKQSELCREFFPRFNSYI